MAESDQHKKIPPTLKQKVAEGIKFMYTKISLQLPVFLLAGSSYIRNILYYYRCKILCQAISPFSFIYLTTIQKNIIIFLLHA